MSLGAEIAGEWSRVFSGERDGLDEEGQRLFVLAPNAIEWCVRPEFLNSPSLYEFSGSYMTVRDYFQLRCPVCNPGPNLVELRSGHPADCWGKTRSQLEDEVLLTWNLEYEEDVCPKCGHTRSQLLEDGLLYPYNQLHLLIGMRAGKSMTAAMIGTYMEHFLLTVGHTWEGGLHGYLDISRAEKYEMTFVAASAVQSQDTIWSKFTGFRGNSPWFQRYVPWIRRQEKAQPDLGMAKWRYIEGTSPVIKNEHPDIRLIINSANSNSATTVGRTRINGLLDELGRMVVGSGRTSGAEIYRGMESSLETIRAQVQDLGLVPWLGSMVSVSSPVSREDEAYKLWRKSDSIADMYCKRYPTWDFNPKQPRGRFAGKFQKDPVAAERDFGANPPGAEYPLIRNETQFSRVAVDWGAQHAHPRARFSTRYQQVGDRTYAVMQLDRHDLIRERAPRFVFGDAGESFDAFGLGMAHGEYLPTGVDGETQWTTVYDWVYRVFPRQRGEEVWFQAIVEILAQVSERVQVAKVRTDRWQSVHLIQQARQHVPDSEKMSLKPADHDMFQQDAADGKVLFLPPEPEALPEDYEPGDVFDWQRNERDLDPHSVAILEVLRLQQDPVTRKVSSPVKGGGLPGEGSDDLAQVIVGLHTLVQRSGYTERHDDRTKRAAREKVEAAMAGLANTGRGVGRVFTPGQGRSRAKGGEPTSARGTRRPGGGSRRW